MAEDREILGRMKLKKYENQNREQGSAPPTREPHQGGPILRKLGIGNNKNEGKLVTAVMGERKQARFGGQQPGSTPIVVHSRKKKGLSVILHWTGEEGRKRKKTEVLGRGIARWGVSL